MSHVAAHERGAAAYAIKGARAAAADGEAEGLARRVAEHLPEKLRTVVTSRMRPTDHADSVLAAELDHTHPGAATSLREGMTETLTVLRLKQATHPRPDVPLDERWRA